MRKNRLQLWGLLLPLLAVAGLFFWANKKTSDDGVPFGACGVEFTSVTGTRTVTACKSALVEVVYTPTSKDIELSQKAAQWDAIKWKLTQEQRDGLISTKNEEYGTAKTVDELILKYDSLINR